MQICFIVKLRKAAVMNTCFKPVIVNRVVVRDKDFLYGLGKVLKLKWLLGKPIELRRSHVDRVTQCLTGVAVENNDFVSLNALTEKMDVNFGTYDNVTPLHIACELGNLEMINFLLAKGASPHRANRFGHCPFYMAINYRRHEAVKLLHFRNVTINLHPVRIATEMIQAVQDKDYSLLHAWALSGVDMDTKDYDGRTVMHEAVYLKSKSMITKLLEYGATPLEKDVWGQTAMDNARNDTAIMALFDPLFTVCCPTKEDYLLYKAHG